MKLFKENDISRLPVVDNTGIQGIITMDDIVNTILHPEKKAEGWARYGEWIGERSHYLDLPVEGVMSERLSMMPSDSTVDDVLNNLQRFHYRGMMIGDEVTIAGIITKKDLLEPLLSTQIQQPLYVQFAGELEEIEGFNKQQGLEEIQEIFEKYQEYLDNANVYVYLKQHKEKNRGLSLIYCKIRFSSPRGMFIAGEEGWGFMQALKNAGKVIDRQIRKSKPR
jgi:ribosome-associated translation inhibitor RaiA